MSFFLCLSLTACVCELSCILDVLLFDIYFVYFVECCYLWVSITVLLWWKSENCRKIQMVWSWRPLSYYLA